MEQLTDKQRIFIEEYLIDLNATQAAIRAGYSEETAHQIGYENLRKPEIKAAVTMKIEARNRRLGINADYVLARLVDIDVMSVKDILNQDGTIKQVEEWPDIWAEMIAGIEVTELFKGRGDDREMVALLKKIKWPDKLKNLELIGRHVGVQAWKDKVESDNLHTVILHDSSTGTSREY